MPKSGRSKNCLPAIDQSTRRPGIGTLIGPAFIKSSASRSIIVPSEGGITVTSEVIWIPFLKLNQTTSSWTRSHSNLYSPGSTGATIGTVICNDSPGATSFSSVQRRSLFERVLSETRIHRPPRLIGFSAWLDQNNDPSFVTVKVTGWIVPASMSKCSGTLKPTLYHSLSPSLDNRKRSTGLIKELNPVNNKTNPATAPQR